MNVTTVIIILGSPNAADGRLYSIALERAATGYDVYQKNADTKLLLTGGMGAHFNTTEKPHAFYMKQHLLMLGIPECDFLDFALSRNTVEDASLAKPIVECYSPKRIVVVTSDFHCDRAKFIFAREFADSGYQITLVASTTDEEQCELDLASLIAHERTALARLTSVERSIL